MSPAPLSIDHLVPLVYDDVNPALHPVARYSLLAHLIRLRDTGRVLESDTGWQQAE